MNKKKLQKLVDTITDSKTLDNYDKFLMFQKLFKDSPDLFMSLNLDHWQNVVGEYMLNGGLLKDMEYYCD